MGGLFKTICFKIVTFKIHMLKPEYSKLWYGVGEAFIIFIIGGEVIIFRKSQVVGPS